MQHTQTRYPGKDDKQRVFDEPKYIRFYSWGMEHAYHGTVGCC